MARVLFLVLLVSGTYARAASSTTAGEAVVSTDGNHFSQRFSRGKNVIVVDVRVRAFQKAEHKLNLYEGAVQQVDGRQALGVDSGPPEGLKSEIVSIQVSWSGVRRSVDKRFFADCFNASALPYRVLVSDDFRAVMITTDGGDGGGAYRVTWIVPKEGAVSRFVAGTDELTWKLPNKASHLAVRFAACR